MLGPTIRRAFLACIALWLLAFPAEAWTPEQLKAAIILIPSYASLTSQVIANDINAQTTTGIPAAGSITGIQFTNCLHWTEYVAQTAQVQATINTLMLMPAVPGGTVSNFVSQMFTAIGATMPLTGTCLAALAATLTEPTWQPAVTAGDIQTALAQP